MISDITKPMALDETLQATNTELENIESDIESIGTALGALDSTTDKIAKDSTLQDTNTALDALGKDTTLQAIATAIANVGMASVGNLASLTTTDKTSLVAALNEVNGDVGDLDTDKADKVTGADNGNLAGLDSNGNLIDAGWSADKTTTSASGNPISISGLKSDQLAVNPIITLEPIQAGSGTPSPSNIRAISGYDKVEALSCGKNLACNFINQANYDMTVARNGDNITFSSDDRGGAFITSRLKAGTTYILNYTVVSGSFNQVRLYSDFNATTNLGTITPNVAFTPSQDGYIRFWVTSASPTVVISNLQLEEGSSATSYEPPVIATSISESLGQTVYGATWNPRTGKLLGTIIGVIYDGSSDEAWSMSEFTGHTFAINLAQLAKGTALDSIISNKYRGVAVSTWNDLANYDIALHPSQYHMIRVRDDNYTSVDAFKASLVSNPLVVCYELATPFEIQLTPHELTLLKTYAYISTNGSNIQLSYHNGEMASLGDVSQLGETLNELGEYLQRDATIGDMVDLTSYTAANNRYIFPSDGYIFINGRNNTSGYIRVYVYGKSSSTVNAGIGMNITAIQSIQSLFVKKGMSCYVSTELSASSIIVGFNPIK